MVAEGERRRPSPSARQERGLGVGVEVGAAAPSLGVGFGRSGDRSIDRFGARPRGRRVCVVWLLRLRSCVGGCAASGSVWVPERRLRSARVSSSTAWALKPTARLGRGLGTGVCVVDVSVFARFSEIKRATLFFLINGTGKAFASGFKKIYI